MLDGSFRALYLKSKAAFFAHKIIDIAQYKCKKAGVVWQSRRSKFVVCGRNSGVG